MKETVWLLPGLGADKRLFSEQLAHNSNWIVPEWIEPLEGESLDKYCTRWIEVCLAEKIELPTYIVGVSFGGLAALTLSEKISLKGVAIISGCFSAESITSQFKAQVAVLKFTPDSLIKYMVKEVMYPRIISTEDLTDEQTKGLQEMASNFDVQFFRWSSEQSAKWIPKGEKSDYTCDIVQVHGENDLVIPKVDKDVDILIEGGKHLIQYTHAKKINSIIDNLIKSPVNQEKTQENQELKYAD